MGRTMKHTLVNLLVVAGAVAVLWVACQYASNRQSYRDAMRAAAQPGGEPRQRTGPNAYEASRRNGAPQDPAEVFESY